LIFLHEQQDRLSEILKGLQGEFDTFETKLTQIDRQIDAIERNERLIEMTREQKQILRSYEKFGKVGNLTQLESKLAQLQAIQNAQLESLSKSGIRHDYEREAREQLAGEVGGNDPFDGIELDSETFLLDEPQAAAEVESTSTDLAFADPIVIEPKRR
jgi:phage shock protein A